VIFCFPGPEPVVPGAPRLPRKTLLPWLSEARLIKEQHSVPIGQGFFPQRISRAQLECPRNSSARHHRPSRPQDSPAWRQCAPGNRPFRLPRPSRIPTGLAAWLTRQQVSHQEHPADRRHALLPLNKSRIRTTLPRLAAPTPPKASKRPVGGVRLDVAEEPLFGPSRYCARSRCRSPWFGGRKRKQLPFSTLGRMSFGGPPQGLGRVL